MSLKPVSSKQRPWAESFGTFFVCLVLGPPLGGIVGSLIITLPFLFDAHAANSTNSIVEKIGLVVGTTIFLLPLSYLFGGKAAFASGVCVVAYAWVWRRVPLWLAMTVACIVFAVSRYNMTVSSNYDFKVSFVVHLVAAFVCWLIIRKIWQDFS